MSMKKQKKIMIAVAAIIIALSLIAIAIDSLIPKISTEYIDRIGSLREKYTLYNVPPFQSKGKLFLIQESYFLSHQIVVFGIFDDNPEIFRTNPNVKNFEKSGAGSFYVPGFVGEFAETTQLKGYINKTKTSNYVLVEGGEPGRPDVLCYTFTVTGSRHNIMIDPASNFFILETFTR